MSMKSKKHYNTNKTKDKRREQLSAKGGKSKGMDPSKDEIKREQ